MTDQRHANLSIHSAGAGEAHPLHRAQIVRRFRLTVYALLAVLLLAALATMLLRIARADALVTRTAEQNQQHVLTVQATTNANTEPVLLPGTLQGSVEAPIYARSSGYVKRWHVDIGTRVRKGDLLLEIAAPEIDLQLSQAIAARAQLVSTAELAASSFTRWQALRTQDAVSQQELDERQSAMVQARSTLAAADANIQRLRELTAFQRIVAPFSGTITRRNVEVGDLVDAGNGGAAKALFTLAQTDALKIYLFVPQAYAQAIQPGAQVNVLQPDQPNKVIRGTIARSAGAIDAASRTLQIEVAVPNADGKLLAGTYVNVALPTQARKTLTVPTNSLLLRAEGPRIGVVAADGHIRLQPVTLGADFGLTVEVLSGISATDRLVINPPDSLADGDAVVAVPQKPKAAS